MEILTTEELVKIKGGQWVIINGDLKWIPNFVPTSKIKENVITSDIEVSSYYGLLDL